MNNGIFSIYSQIFTFVSLLMFAASLIAYPWLKKHATVFVRLSLVFACLFSLVASFSPLVAIVVTIAFVPSTIYHMFTPLVVAPFVVGVAGYLGCWCVLTLMHELFGFMKREPRTRSKQMLFAIILFGVLGNQVSNSLLDYKIIFNGDKILAYASKGNDPGQLERIYTEVALSHDNHMFDEMLSLLALNPNAPTELLNVIYARTMDSDLDTTRQNYILLDLSKNPNLSSDLLKKLMVSVSHVASTPANAQALSSASRNPNLSAVTMHQLASYPDCEIRRAMLSYPNISEGALTQIIEHDPDLGVRHDAKRRLEFLHGISHLDVDQKPNDKQDSTFADAAENLTDPDKLEEIFKNLDLDENPAKVLKNLASNCYIGESLAREIYAKATDEKGFGRTSALMALSVNPKTPQDILNLLAAEKDLVILRGLASNPNIPYEVIDRFAPYPDCKIRKEIICLPNASRSILKQLSNDKDESVALEAAERLREESAYLDICEEMKSLNPSCQKYYGAGSVPEMRAFPNTSERNKQELKATVMQFFSAN